MATFQLDESSKIAVNHAGYGTLATKSCIMSGTEALPFVVRRTEDHAEVYRGRMIPQAGDFGTYLVGDFSALQSEGSYEVVAGGEHSYAFNIRSEVYAPAIGKAIGYFRKQRCGNTTENWRQEPCHLDDGKIHRGESWEHRDTTGGWHDACDVRKWQQAVVHGLIGLTQIWEEALPHETKLRLLDELKWGNAYQLKLQEPEGYVLSNVGLDSQDGDCRWTDNVIDSSADSDDRQIQDNPSTRIGMWLFVLGNATLALRSAPLDPAYSAICHEAAVRQYDWFRREIPIGHMNSWELGAAMVAAAALYRLDAGNGYRQYAKACAASLLALQDCEYEEGRERIRGFFRTSHADASPSRDSIGGSSWPLIGLCEWLELFPGDAEAESWKAAVHMYCDEYLMPLANRTAFRIVPFGLYDNRWQGAGTNRPLGTSGYTYRFFMYRRSEKASDYWYCGNNAVVASAGVGLVKAGRLLGEPAYVALAQRQLDWILGCNPFNSTTMTGVGYNEGRHFVHPPLDPYIPLLEGGVRNGICGDAADQPNRAFLEGGEWNSMEYWTPMVSYTAWLMHELHLAERLSPT